MYFKAKNTTKLNSTIPPKTIDEIIIIILFLLSRPRARPIIEAIRQTNNNDITIDIPPFLVDAATEWTVD